MFGQMNLFKMLLESSAQNNSVAMKFDSEGNRKK